MAKTKYYVEYPSSSIKYEIEQSTHGFTVGIAIANSGGTWIKASSDDDEKLGRLVVESVEDANNFTVVESGEIILTGLTEGSYYVVDDSGDGSLVEFSEGLSYEYSNPILQAVSSSKAHVLPWRPSVQGDLSIQVTYMVAMWAEENSTLGATTYEWAFGDGAATPNDGGVTIYVPSGEQCHVVAMSLRLGSGTATVELVHNGTLKGSAANVAVASGQGNTNELSSPLSISDGDYLNFYTTSAAGTSAPNVATMWLKYEST